MSQIQTEHRPSGLELRNISKVYKTSKRDVVAVSSINLTIEPGEFVTLLGPSGCGKTTNLRMIAGFETPTTGEILLDGENIVPIPPNQRPMSMVFQSYALFPHLNVEKNIAFGLHVKRVPKAEMSRRVNVAMETMDLKEYAHRAPHELSGGQQQRVALARALVMEPRVLLFDEPLSNLDAKLRDQMRLEIRRIQQEFGITSIFVTHDQDEAMTMSDKIVVMSHGKIEQVGSPQQVYKHPTSRFVAEFLGSANFFDVLVERISHSTDQPMATVVLNGERMELPCASSIDDDCDGALLMMRAEDLMLSTEPSNIDVHWIKGSVAASAFHGDSVHYVVDTGSEKPLTVRVNGYTTIHPIGTDVHCGIPADRAWILPA